MQDYIVKNQQEVWIVVGSRVSLGSVVKSYLEGESAESIQEAYPSLSLESVYGAIAFYLSNRDEIDRELACQDEAAGRLRSKARANNADLRARLRKAKAGAQ